MTVKFLIGIIPLFVLCCILAFMISCQIEGMQVGMMLFALNGAGIVLAAFHGLEFRI